MEVSNDPLVLTFIRSKNLKQGTQDRYLYVLKVYGEFLDMAPNEWIQKLRKKRKTV
jgi:hypothetical protein